MLTYAHVCLNAQASVAEKERLALSAEAAQQQLTLVQDAMRNEVLRLDELPLQSTYTALLELY
jgi:hypothetical protein